MAVSKFVWIIRTWCSVDTYWEHVREHKEYDIAYAKPELILEEIDRIVLKEKTEWEDLCQGSGLSKEDRVLDSEKPSLEQIKHRSFFKFLTITSSEKAAEDFMQTWYVERIKVVDTN